MSCEIVVPVLSDFFLGSVTLGCHAGLQRSVMTVKPELPWSRKPSCVCGSEPVSPMGDPLPGSGSPTPERWSLSPGLSLRAALHTWERNHFLTKILGLAQGGRLPSNAVMLPPRSPSRGPFPGPGPGPAERRERADHPQATAQTTVGDQGGG